MKRDNPHPDSARGQSRRRVLLSALAIPATAVLSACQIPVPGQGPPPLLYRLTPKSTFENKLPAVPWQLVVETPLADAGIDSTRVALQHTPTLLEYYARASWTDRAPVMVQTLIIESFENSHRIVAVGRDVVSLRADFVLKTELREFQVEYFDEPSPRAHVGITARLVQLPRRAIIGTESFESIIPAEADTLDGVVAAFDEALGKVLRHLVIWTLETGEAARAKKKT
jgi:cholesterol transport system auxiliary component